MIAHLRDNWLRRIVAEHRPACYAVWAVAAVAIDSAILL